MKNFQIFKISLKTMKYGVVKIKAKMVSGQ